jgi:hypothetical protein
MSVWYLELDDEITDAVARLRAAKDERVVVVVPPGSRIGTGRINFRLLAREAETRGLGIALVSGDPQVRALAASAGLAVFATVSESEAAPTASLVPNEAVAAAGPTVVAPVTSGPTSSTAPGPGASQHGAVAVADGLVRRTGSPDTRRRRSLSHRAKVVGGSLAVVALLGGGGLYGAYVTIPRASIALTQTAHQNPPEALTLQIVPDQPTDATAGVIHGQWLPVPVTVTGTVTATGTAEPLTDRAKGTATFTNHSVNPIPIPDQTVLRTASGVGFLTQGGIVVPPGASMDVEIRAAQAGGGGNVDAGTISVMSDELKGILNGGTVTNKDPTSGGKSVPQMRILEADYAAALGDLTGQLRSELERQAASPPGLPSDGVVYASTVRPGTVTTDPGSEVVVGQPVPTQQISASMTGSVLTASMAEIEDVAARMLQARSPGTNFVDGSIHVVAGEPDISADGVVTYSATATGSAYDKVLDQAALKEQIRGKTKSAAQVILRDYGTAIITLSPDFMPTLPDDPSRIDLTITPLGGS